MGYTPTIYCQLSFIERLLDQCRRPTIDSIQQSGILIEALSACYKLVFGPAKIFIDITPQKLLNHPDPEVKKLWKNHTATLKCDKDFNGKLNDDAFWENLTTELFFLDEPENAADELEQDWGVLVITPGNLHQKARCFTSSSPIFVKKGETGFSWEHFKESRHCFHTILIADNYLDADENKLKLNLLPLLQSISSGSPRKRKTHLTILTTSDNIKLLHQKLSTLLPAAGLDFEIRVVKINKDNNHDRNLITNQRWISSGYGFNLLKQDALKKCSVAEKTTTLHSMPLLSNGTITPEEVKNNPNDTTTYFSVAMSIVEILEKIDHEIPESIGTETRTMGFRNPKPLTKRKS